MVKRWGIEMVDWVCWWYHEVCKLRLGGRTFNYRQLCTDDGFPLGYKYNYISLVICFAHLVISDRWPPCHHTEMSNWDPLSPHYSWSTLLCSCLASWKQFWKGFIWCHLLQEWFWYCFNRNSRKMFMWYYCKFC